MHSYIFPLLFTALFKLGLRFNFALKRNCCVVESVFVAVVVIEMTLIMMIVIEWGWRCDAFVCVVTDFPSSVQCFVFILWRNVMMVMQMWVSSQRLCKLFVFASLVFLRFFFGSRVTSFCSAFGGYFDSWSVCFCFLFCVMKIVVVLVVVTVLECCCIIALLLLGCFWTKSSVFFITSHVFWFGTCCSCFCFQCWRLFRHLKCIFVSSLSAIMTMMMTITQHALQLR